MQVIDYQILYGTADEVILTMKGIIPSRIFIEEILASRTHEDIALPVYGQPISSH